MEIEQLLRELQTLEHLYKTNFDLVSQKVDNQAELISKVVLESREALEEIKATNELLKDVIAEKDVQIQRLIKATAALTVIGTQLVERFNSTRQTTGV